MGNLRPVLIMGLVFLAYMMWVEWQKDYGPAPQQPSVPVVSESSQPDAADIPVLTGQEGSIEDLPQVETPTQPQAGTDTSEARSERQMVKIQTDVLDVKIDLVGGTVVSAVLRNYPVVLHEPDVKFELLQESGNNKFIAQSGLLSGSEAPNHTSLYTSERMEYVVGGDAGELSVPLSWVSADGLRVTKTFIFQPGNYEIGVLHEVENQSGNSWTGSGYLQLQRTVPGDEDSGGFNNPERYSFFGIGFYNPEDKFE